jgi:hypothetical protein
MIDDSESLRLHLSETWKDGKDGPTSDDPPQAVARRSEKPAAQQRLCGACGGGLVRSRIRFYERLASAFMTTRPYRCLDCMRRAWR